MAPSSDRLLLACHFGFTSFFNAIQLFVTTHIGAYGGPEPGAVHISLVLLPGDGSPPQGLQAVPLRAGRYTPDLTSKHVRYYDTGLDAEGVARVWAWAEAHVGDWYDFVGLLTCAKFEIEHRLGLRDDVTAAFYRHPRSVFFCSAFAAAALRVALPDLAPGLPVVKVPPAALEYDALQMGMTRWTQSGGN